VPRDDTLAKSKSHQTPISNQFPLGLYHITVQLGSQDSKIKSQEQHDSVFGSLETTRMNVPGVYTESQTKEIIKKLKRKGYKKIKKEEVTHEFNRMCPSCHRNGSPGIVKWMKRYTIKENTMSDQEKTHLITTRLVYHHSKSPETCLVGNIEISKKRIEIKLKKGLSADALSLRSRIRDYNS
jgi:hypothetical protein